MDLLIFDIETIPQQTPLTDSQKVLLAKELKRFYPDGPPDALPSDKEFLDYKEEYRKQCAVNPYLGEIVCICTMRVSEDRFKPGSIKTHIESFYGSEKSMLEGFWNYIRREKFRFVSYNGLGFDIHWILKKSMKYGIRPTNDDFLVTRRFQRWPHFDVMAILQDWDRRFSVPLDLACETFGIQTPKGGAIVAKTVEQTYKSGNIAGIVEYCEKDLTATHELYKIVSQYQPKT